jgi:flagellar biogenesis protein FliO
LVTALAVFVLVVARRSGMGRAQGPLSLAGRLVLDARRAIYLVRVGDVLYVVGASEAGLSKLGELARDAVGVIDQNAPAPASFKDLLARLLAKPPKLTPDAAERIKHSEQSEPGEGSTDAR